MCDICKQTPCHHRCPNALEPKPIEEGIKCGEGIYEGDRYLITVEGCICVDCLEGQSVDEWLNIMGESLETAER